MENIRDTDPPDRPSNLANTSGLSQDTPPPPGTVYHPDRIDTAKRWGVTATVKEVRCDTRREAGRRAGAGEDEEEEEEAA